MSPLREEAERIVYEVLQKVRTADAVVLAEAIRYLAILFAKYVEKLEERLQLVEKQLDKVEEELRMHRDYMENLAKAIHDIQRAVAVIGYRYEVYTEEVFRSSIKYLVEDLLKAYRVEKWSYYDEQGYVYGHPAVIDVDVLIGDREHVVVEYNAHADRSDVAELYRIAQLYEKVTGVKPRTLLVSPTITRKARELAEKLGVEVRGTIVD